MSVYYTRYVRNMSGKYETSEIVYNTILNDEKMKENIFYVNVLCYVMK